MNNQVAPLNIVTISLATAGALLLVAAAVDYNRWIAFGTGGTPPNLQGYLKITKFRLLRLLSNDDLRDASKLDSNGPSYLEEQLRHRARPRPRIIERTLPQRQYPEALDEASYERVHSLPRKYAEKYNHLLKLDKSATEGASTDAIYAMRHTTASGFVRAHDRVLGDEIVHVHPADNSLHVWLTQADARKVVEAGWGERFPLSSLGMVDDGWTFVYAPQTMEDVDVIEEIVKAGIGHLTGEKIP